MASIQYFDVVGQQEAHPAFKAPAAVVKLVLCWVSTEKKAGKNVFSAVSFSVGRMTEKVV